MKYTLMVVAFTAIISLTYMTMVYLAHSEIGRDVSTYCNATIAAELQQRSNSIIGYISLGTLAISLLLTVLGVIATHRIAGPIFVMNRYLGVLCSGRIPKMRIAMTETKTLRLLRPGRRSPRAGACIGARSTWP